MRPVETRRDCDQSIVVRGRRLEEVVKGGTPSFASDAWALGCLGPKLVGGSLLRTTG